MSITLLKRTPPKGQTFCEKCSKPVLSWTIRTILKDGHFYDVCRTCYSNIMESADETLNRFSSIDSYSNDHS